MTAQEETSQWRVPIDKNTVGRAKDITLFVAERLESKALIAKSIEQTAKQTQYFSWSPYSFASGEAGLSLLWSHLARCFPDCKWENKAHSSLSNAVKDAENVQLASPSLFGGLAGLAFSANYAARGTSRYSALLGKLDTHIAANCAPSISSLEREQIIFGLPVESFDLISGLSGVAVYLMERYGQSKEVDRTLEGILACLVKLSREINGIPAWHTPKHFMMSYDTMSRIYLNGYVNCGLAHGILGPLGAMAAAKILGLHIDGMEGAIDFLSTWILEHRHDDEWGHNWPNGIALSSELGKLKVCDPKESPPSHAAWCYGSPGIARTIFLSGVALSRPDLQRAAAEIIIAALNRPSSARALHSAMFCHGLSGFLQICLRIQSESQDKFIGQCIPRIVSDVIDCFNENYFFGFQSMTPEGICADNPSLLDGAAGVALALASVCGQSKPDWDRAFLLS